MILVLSKYWKINSWLEKAGRIITITGMIRGREVYSGNEGNVFELDEDECSSAESNSTSKLLASCSCSSHSMDVIWVFPYYCLLRDDFRCLLIAHFLQSVYTYVLKFQFLASIREFLHILIAKLQVKCTTWTYHLSLCVQVVHVIWVEEYRMKWFLLQEGLRVVSYNTLSSYHKLW